MDQFNEDTEDYFDWLSRKAVNYIGQDLDDEDCIDDIIDLMFSSLNYIKKNNFRCENSHAIIALTFVLQNLVKIHSNCDDFDSFVDNIDFMSTMCEKSIKNPDESIRCADSFGFLYRYLLSLKSVLKKNINYINNEMRSVYSMDYSDKDRAIKLLNISMQLILKSKLHKKLIAHAIKEINAIIDQLSKEKTNWTIVSVKMINAIALFSTLATLTSGIDAAINIRDHLVESQHAITNTAVNPHLTQSVPFQLGRNTCHTPMLSPGSSDSSLPIE